MNSTAPTPPAKELPPLPKDPRHQRFADLRLRGRSLAQAYVEAGFSAKGANSNAVKLEARADVAVTQARLRA